ncbi:MAG: RluA family pseudouridine synthase [Acidimicrobiales bacterium]
MASADQRLDRRVAAEAGCSRAIAHDLVEAGAVQVDGRVERRPAHRVADDAVVVVDHEPPIEPAVEADAGVVVSLVHADDHLYVVDKPAGLVVHPGSGTDEPTLVHGLLALDPGLVGVGPDPTRPGIVHRLDRGTSGLLVVARTEEAHERLSAMIAAHDIEREYAALVAGTVPEATGRIEAAIGRDPQRPTLQAVTPDGRPAATDYEVEDRYADPEPATLLAVRLETGRTHQIRVHFSAIGHPVIGDRAYGDRSGLPLDHPFLHSRRLAFTHPVTGEWCEFTAALPEDLEAVLAVVS